MNLNWTPLYGSDSIDSKVEYLNGALLECFYRHALLKKILFKNLPPPWITGDIKSQMQQRHLSRRAWRRSDDAVDYRSFKILRNKTQIAVRNARRKYYTTFFGGTGDAENL